MLSTEKWSGRRLISQRNQRKATSSAREIKGQLPLEKRAIHCWRVQSGGENISISFQCDNKHSGNSFIIFPTKQGFSHSSAIQFKWICFGRVGFV